MPCRGVHSRAKNKNKNKNDSNNTMFSFFLSFCYDMKIILKKDVLLLGIIGMVLFA